LKRHLKRWLLPADTWERHFFVARFAAGAKTVLDVGGIAEQLASFMPDAEVTALNVGDERADVHFDGLRIPYPDASFEVVVSLDVLEHIDRQSRAVHLTELARVAAHRIVLCCPLGTPEHVEAERELAAWYRETTGSPHRFLEEHIERGLPTETEIEELASSAGLDARLYFHGDFRRANHLFQLSTRLRQRPTPRSLAAYAAARLDLRRDRELAPASGPCTNRVFVVAESRLSAAGGEPG
jgi:Methyltransferase domain